MKFELKPISRAGIPEALEKVERYRLLNEPAQAPIFTPISCRGVWVQGPRRSRRTGGPG